MVRRSSKVIDPEYQRGYVQGLEDGKKQGHQAILDFLEQKYMDPSRSTNSAEGKATLALAREAAEHIRGLQK